eukprot:TRINITY_DN5721_c0_g3_i2.p1 TRINITY_DN5721_c0_g3~~TRINITY_DN5721_c0_g3_i2.p1  ORF type:complete len:546 (-),score=128.11 TRINITY_DN5721_c0_g3_i2:73-1710(-)
MEVENMNSSLTESFISVLQKKDDKIIHRIISSCLKQRLISVNELPFMLQKSFTYSNRSHREDLSESYDKFSAENSLKDLSVKENQETTINVPLKLVIQNQFDEFYQFLTSGEVEGMSYENYLLLYQEIQEYKQLDMLKDKKKRAFKLYEQYITKSAPSRVILDDKIVHMFDTLFRKIDNSLFDRVYVVIENQLSSVKSKFLQSKFNLTKNSDKISKEVKIQTNNLKSFKKQYFKMETKDTLSDQFKCILKDEELLLRFRTFLEGMFCDDTLGLWLRIEHFIEFYDQYTPQQIINILRYYNDEFISDEAQHQIPFPFNVKDKWESIISSKNISNKNIVDLIKITREELSKDLHNHTIDFIKVWKENTVDKKRTINFETMNEGVHKQIFKAIGTNESLKEFICFLESKFCSENLLFWLAIEDLRNESYESKRREKALVYLKRFIDSDGAESVFMPSELQNLLINMITDKKIYLEMKPFDQAQKLIESALQPLVIQFNNLLPKSRKNLIKDANSKKHQMLANLKGREHRPTFFNFMPFLTRFHYVYIY